jgi:hypothetical protein
MPIYAYRLPFLKNIKFFPEDFHLCKGATILQYLKQL